MTARNLSIKERFLDHVFYTESCWFWAGAENGHGYGRFNDGINKNAAAHRTAYKLFKGEIPKDLYVLHRCDNRLCVNPTHLFLGTQSDNLRDMWRKGRRTL